MTKLVQFIVLAVLLVTFPVLFLHSASDEQIPEPVQAAEEVPSPVDGASIGGGLLILISLATGYRVKRIYDDRRETEEGSQ